ncbi:MAG: hypothetical protein MZW92_46590 [Comamonadaceae bacterium]|nr:hypothetical protein [Comamonadaceae bacterium]
MVRQGKGAKDRVTMLPASLVVPLQEQLARVRVLFDADRERGPPGVAMPTSRGVASLSIGCDSGADRRRCAGTEATKRRATSRPDPIGFPDCDARRAGPMRRAAVADGRPVMLPVSAGASRSRRS